MKYISRCRRLIVLASIITVGFFSVTTSLYAIPESYTLLEPLPCIPSSDIPCGPDGLIKKVGVGGDIAIEDYVKYAFDFFIALAAVASVFMIVWGGFTYMTTDSFSGKSEGREKVKNAVYGLLLVLCSYLILQTINPSLVAIPKGLVPKLQIDSDKFRVDYKFFEELTREADNFNIRSQEFNRALASAENNIKSETKKINDLIDEVNYLQYQLGLPDEDPEVQKLLARIVSSNNYIIDEKVRVEKETAKAIIFNGVISRTNSEYLNANGNRTKIEKSLESSKDYLNTIRGQTIASIQKKRRYNSSDIDEINDLANYAELKLETRAFDAISNTYGRRGSNVIDITTGESIGTPTKTEMLDSLKKISNRMGNVKDENLRRDLEGEIQNISLRINSLYQGVRDGPSFQY